MAPELPTLYFAFGSNMWINQMQARCPNSRCLGIARLPGYRWIITEQGGSNIIEEPCTYDSEV